MLCLNLTGKEYTTDENGRIELVGVKDDLYYIYEEKAPEGYKPLEGSIGMYVSYGEMVRADPYNYKDYDLVKAGENEIYVTNKPNKIVINKVDEEGNPLSGAIFRLYYVPKDGSSGGESLQVISDENGKIELELEDNYYTIYEEEAPEGYAKLEELISVEVRNGKWVLSEDYGDAVRIGENNELYIVNEPNKIVINKVDEEGNPLPGAVFRIHR